MRILLVFLAVGALARADEPLLQSRKYDLGPVLAAAKDNAKRHPGISRPTTPDSLRLFIQKLVDPSVWTEASVCMEAKEGGLQVTAPPETLDKIQMLLKDFGSQIAAPLAPAESEPAEPEWRKEIRLKLAQPLHFQLEGIPFKDAMEFLGSQGKIELNLDSQALEAVPGLETTPVRLSSPAQGMPVGRALDDLAKQVGLVWILRDESVTLTTLVGAKEPAESRSYDVRDLLTAERAKAKKGPAKDVDVVDFVKAHVEKSVWSEEGNSVEALDGRLFVTAPPAVHAGIRECLKSLRKP